jgi:hypothetical protein
MDRRRLVLTLPAGVLTPPLAVEAQQTGKVWWVGILAAGSVSPRDRAAFARLN